MKAITKFQTSDGKEFLSEVDASAHQSGLDNKAKIDAFVDRHYPKPTEGKAGPTRALAAKAIALWLSENPAPTLVAAEV